ncbi:LolA family protein [Desulfogranum japonicum]|uniref:LolA family protein n=1 Tax=Desulfogranum japonicum TaxID=231447 RepID=UPI00137761C7|nr:outer membrane lipoprotein carrier protein LolA [Desulfogranum japonicum]
MRKFPLTLQACILLLSLLLPAISFASNAELVSKVKKLQQYYQSLESITFDFEQQTYSNGRNRKGSGNATFVRTGPAPSSTPLMRWNYLTPYEQIILSTGAEMQIYTKQDNQLIITPAESMDNDITFSLFSGHLSLDEAFNIDPADDNAHTPGISTAILTPKKAQQQVQAIQIWFDDNHTLERIRIDDHFGTQTMLTLSDFAVNSIKTSSAEVLMELGHLDIPPETEIIRQ